MNATDGSFNPNVIVVDYETSEDAERNITAGGRVQYQKGKIRIGTSFIHEDGSGQDSGTKGNLLGVDLVAQITENIEARFEYGISETTSNDQGSETSDAVLAEIIHTSETYSAEAYFREEDVGYGLGHSASNTAGFRRYGARAAVNLRQSVNAESGRRTVQGLTAEAYREENLATGSSRDTAEVQLSHQTNQMALSAGLRAARDEFSNGLSRESILAIASGSLQVPKLGATFQIAHEQPLGGSDEVSNFPGRTLLGVDKMIGKKATLSVRHEILDGENSKGQNTTFGLSLSPWSGMAMRASTDLLTNDSGRRLGSTIAVDQQVRLDKNVTASLGLTNRSVLDEDEDYVDVSADGVASPIEQSQDFSSAYLGLAYNSDTTTVSGRLETRMSSSGDTWIGSLAASRELSETLSLAGTLRRVSDDPDGIDQGDSQRLDMRFGAAWRPRGDELVVLNRLDVGVESNELDANRSKIVNNLAANTMIDERWQLSANYGVKYVREDIAGQKYSNMTHLIGGETRFDVTEKIDLGFGGSALIGSGSNQYSFGPSIGFSPVDDVWLSAGYNFDGFNDRDFQAAEYSRKGLYLKLRIKFDQNSARGLLKHISPDTDSVGPATRSPSAFSNP